MLLKCSVNALEVDIKCLNTVIEKPRNVFEMYSNSVLNELSMHPKMASNAWVMPIECISNELFFSLFPRNSSLLKSQ